MMKRSSAPYSEVYVFGAAKDDFFQSKLDYVEGKTHWPNFQMAKFHQGKARNSNTQISERHLFILASNQSSN